MVDDPLDVEDNSIGVSDTVGLDLLAGVVADNLEVLRSSQLEGIAFSTETAGATSGNILAITTAADFHYSSLVIFADIIAMGCRHQYCLVGRPREQSHPTSMEPPVARGSQ